MAMPNQPLAARAIGLISMGGEKSVQLGLNRLRDQPPARSTACAINRLRDQPPARSTACAINRLRDQLPRTLTQQIRQRVGRKSFWRAKRDNRILRHVAYPFLCENCGASTTP